MQQTPRRRLGVAASFLGLALGIIGLAAAPASANGNEHDNATASDTRAALNQGNVTECSAVGFPTSTQLGASSAVDAADSNVSGDVHGDGNTTLDVTAEDGVVVDAIVVKGGNGYNLYKPGQLGLNASSPWADLISPENNGGQIPTISHWFVCYSGSATHNVTIAKVVTGPGVPQNPTNVSFDVDCDSGTELDPSVVPGAAAVDAATGVTAGDECTITEQSKPEDVTLAWTVVGAENVSNDNDSVTFTVKDTNVVVTATNSYACPAGTVATEGSCVPEQRDGCNNDELVTFAGVDLGNACEDPEDPQDPIVPTPQITTASDPDATVVDCAGPNGTPGLLVTLRNTGNADALFTVTLNGVSVGDPETLTVTPAEGTDTLQLPQAEDEAVAVHITTFEFELDVTLDGDCAAVLSDTVVAPAAPVAAPATEALPTEVEGVQITRVLARTGVSNGGLLIAAGLLLALGGVCLYGSTLPLFDRRR